MEIMNITPADFISITNDVSGNPRYVCHYLHFDNNYQSAIKKANKIGGRKFHNKQYGGGIVFSTYNLQSFCNKINLLINQSVIK